MGTGRAAPSTAGPAKAVTRAPCRRAEGQPRPYSPQDARRQREEGLQDQRKAKGWYQNHGDRAGANAAYWRGQNRPTDDLRPGGKGKNQSKRGGRRGKGSKARHRQQVQHGPPRTEKQHQYQGRRDDRAAQRLSTSLQSYEERRRVVAAATSPARPTREPEGRARCRPGGPPRPGPTGRPNGSSESPGLADGGDFFPGSGARVFPGRDETPVHRSPSCCKFLAPKRGGQDTQAPTAGKSGRRDHRWKKKVGVLTLWMPREMGKRRRLPAGAPTSPQGRDCSREPHDPGSCEPCSPTGVPKRICEEGARLHQTPARSRAGRRVCQRREHAPAHSGDGRTKCQIEEKADKLTQKAGRFLWDVGPSHDWLRGVRVGEATNPGPTMVLPPWQLDPEYTSNFAVFGEGWIAFILLGPIEVCGPLPSFRVKAPSGDKLATLFIAGDRHVFSDLREGQAYVCAEAKPILPQVMEGRHNSTWGSKALPWPWLASVWPRLAWSGGRGTPRTHEHPGRMPTWRAA